MLSVGLCLIEYSCKLFFLGKLLLRIRPVLSAVFPPEHCRLRGAALLHRAEVFWLHDRWPADATERQRKGAAENELASLAEAATVAWKVGSVAVADLVGAFEAEYPGRVVFPSGDEAFDVENPLLVDVSVRPVQCSRAEGFAVNRKALVKEGAVFSVAFLPHLRALDVEVAASGRGAGLLPVSGLLVFRAVGGGFVCVSSHACPSFQHLNPAGLQARKFLLKGLPWKGLMRQP